MKELGRLLAVIRKPAEVDVGDTGEHVLVEKLDPYHHHIIHEMDWWLVDLNDCKVLHGKRSAVYALTALQPRTRMLMYVGCLLCV